MADNPVYVIISRVHVAQWDNDLQETVEGWRLKAQWGRTRTILPVFIPDAAYSPQNVDATIRHAGALDEQIHALGG